MDKTVTVRFNKGHEYEVYSARIAAGLPVRNKQILEHRMVGKVVGVWGNRFYVEAAYKNWSRGYYVVLLLNNFSDSHATLYFETIGNCYDEDILNRIAEHRSQMVVLNETFPSIRDKEQKKIEKTYKIGQLLYPTIVQKHREFKEELAIVEKAGLVSD